ncbi:MAG: alpha/beta fold hydrolase [Comamonadaceae bacterium]|nr:MAG: alpha/beta fold hydrolase [Comamonadaceae bacterium]
MRRTVWLATTLLIASALLGGCAVVDYEQRRWIFMPGQRTWGPGEAAAVGMQDVWIDYVSQHPEQAGQAVRLHGLWLAQHKPGAPVLLFLHGVRWDVRASAARMRQLHRLGFSVLGVDYRGFGRSSEAMPSETLVAEDAQAAWQWMAREHSQSRRFIFGHSLGAAVAVRLAADVQDEAGLIVEGGFTSSLDVLRSTRWGWLPVAPLLTQHFDAASRIAEVGSPLLAVHAGDDAMISPQLGRALYERAQPPKRFVLIKGAVHENADVVGEQAYREALRALFGMGD